jgi:hypothetical protein
LSYFFLSATVYFSHKYFVFLSENHCLNKSHVNVKIDKWQFTPHIFSNFVFHSCLISFFFVDCIINNVNIDFIFLKETFSDNMRSVSLFRFRAMTSWPFFLNGNYQFLCSFGWTIKFGFVSIYFWTLDWRFLRYRFVKVKTEWQWNFKFPWNFPKANSSFFFLLRLTTISSHVYALAFYQNVPPPYPLCFDITLVSKMDYSLEFELLGKQRFSCCV